MLRRNMMALAAAALVMGVTGSAAAQEGPKKPVVLKIGTLAPERSPWGNVFRVWQRAVNDRSKGELQLQFFFTGTQGDEVAMVGKIRTGQLDGAAVTAYGLGTIYKHVLVLQMPGVFKTWQQLDAARAKIQPKLEPEFDKQGFKILGWGDVGEAHLMTRGFKVLKPSDLRPDPGANRNPRVYAIVGDQIAPKLYETLGVSFQKVTVPEILPALTSGNINVLNAPSLAAEQLQWAQQADHINERTTGFGIGALVFSSAKYNALPEHLRDILKETGDVTGKALTNRIRNEDKAAFNRLKARMTTYSSSPAEAAEWDKVFADTRAKLRGAVFDAALFDEVMAAAK